MEQKKKISLVSEVKEFISFQAEVIEMDRDVFSEFFAAYLNEQPIPSDQVNTAKLSFVANQLRFLVELFDGKYGIYGKLHLVEMLTKELEASTSAYAKANAKLEKEIEDIKEQIEEKRHEQPT